MRKVARVSGFTVYPEPQNAPDVSPGMNVPNFPEGKRPKATDVSPWYGVYCDESERVGGEHTSPSPLGYFTAAIGF